MRTQNLGKTLSSGIILGALASLVSACGSQQFASLATTETTQAAGSLTIAPKVDVVLVEDDTGRIQESYGDISSQTASFLTSLDQQGWNYHFTTLRLTTPQGVITQAVAPNTDPNWGSQWVAPYPGAVETQVDMLEPSIFRTISYLAGFTQYSGFLQPGQATNALEGQEPGFATLATDFSTSFPTITQFIRPDALLAVVLVGTGNDTSYVNYCHRADGVVVPCEQVTSSVCTSLSQAQPTGFPAAPANSPTCGSANLSLNTYENQFRALKPSTSQLRFYSAVASINSAAGNGYLCAGGYATAGTRYQQMASGLGGQYYDVCSQSLSSILSSVSENLTSTALSYEKDFIVLKEQPAPTTISVVKYIGGNTGNAVTIPQDATNGWTYVGYLSNQAVIDYPVAMDYESGYMIQLNGTAKMQGADTAAVTYKTPSGANVSQ